VSCERACVVERSSAETVEKMKLFGNYETTEIEIHSANQGKCNECSNVIVSAIDGVGDCLMRILG
jgi:hypothetical protein